MPAKMTTAYRQHDRGERITGQAYRQGVRDKARAAKLNAAIDNDFLKARKNWVFVPPSNMNLLFWHQNTDFIVSVPHELGRVLLSKRRGHIVERNVVPDVVIEYSDLSEAWSVFGLGAGNEPQEPQSILIALIEAAKGIPAGVPIQVPMSFGTQFVDAGLASIVDSGEPALVISKSDIL